MEHVSFSCFRVFVAKALRDSTNPLVSDLRDEPAPQATPGFPDPGRSDLSWSRSDLARRFYSAGFMVKRTARRAG